MPIRRRAISQTKAEFASADILAKTDIRRLANDAQYEASPYHCPTRQPRWVPNKTRCPKHVDKPYALRLLRQGMRRGMFSGALQGLWPRLVWAVDCADEKVYEARLTNREAGEYHGYPIPKDDPRFEEITQKWKTTHEA